MLEDLTFSQVVTLRSNFEKSIRAQSRKAVNGMNSRDGICHKLLYYIRLI